MSAFQLELPCVARTKLAFGTSAPTRPLAPHAPTLRRESVQRRLVTASADSWGQNLSDNLPNSVWGDFEDAFSSFDQRMANMHQDFEAAKQQAHASFNNAFEEIQRLQEDTSQSSSPWLQARQAGRPDAYRSQDLGPQGNWSVRGSNGSWSVHSQSSHSSFGSSYRSESFVVIHQGTSPSHLSISAPAAERAASPFLGFAMLAAAAYAALAALFAHSFHHTNFRIEERSRLSLAWPVLYALSEKFRIQFLKALHGLGETYRLDWLSKHLSQRRAKRSLSIRGRSAWDSLEAMQ